MLQSTYEETLNLGFPLKTVTHISFQLPNYIYSPIVSTRTRSIPKMMETNCIPYNNFSLCNLGDELSCSVAVNTCTKVLCDPNRGPGTCTDKGKSDFQLLTVTPKHAFLHLLCHIMQHKARVGNIPCIPLLFNYFF